MLMYLYLACLTSTVTVARIATIRILTGALLARQKFRGVSSYAGRTCKHASHQAGARYIEQYSQRRCASHL